MSTAQLLSPPDTESRDESPASRETARISFRQPVATSGFIDAAWWPRSLDLAAELPPILEVLWTAAREITRITFNISAWEPAPRRMHIDGRVVRLGGFNTSDPLTVRMSDASRVERIDILVIAPSTDPLLAERELALASQADSRYRAQEIVSRVGDPGPNDPGRLA